MAYEHNPHVSPARFTIEGEEVYEWDPYQQYLLPREIDDIAAELAENSGSDFRQVLDDLLALGGDGGVSSVNGDTGIVTLTADDVDAVPTTRTVSGKALSTDITLDKADVGLPLVDNTSDMGKPISTATDAALNLRQRVRVASTATAASSPVKTVTLSGSLITGDMLVLTLTNGSTADAPSITINGGGAQPVLLGGAAASAGSSEVAAGGIWFLYFTGTTWVLFGPTANLPTVDQATAEAGVSTTRYVWTPERVHQAIQALSSVTTDIGSLVIPQPPGVGDKVLGSDEGVIDWIDPPVGGGGPSSNVFYLPEDFGAVGDGVADDAPAIQDAIDAADAAGGGTVFLSALYGWTGDIVIPNAVLLRGVGQGVQSERGLIALSNTSRLRCGTWVGDEARPAGIRDIKIDGNSTGHPDGLVQLECVMATFVAVKIADAAGVGLYLNAAQNCTFVSVDITNCGTTNVLLRNGAGGSLFSRCENTPGATGSALIIDDLDSTANNAYPFGSAHVQWDQCIFEAYVANTAAHFILIDAGANLRFTSCGFSNNNVDMTAQSLITVNNASFPSVITTAELNSCNFNGGTVDQTPALRIIGNNRVAITGDSYFQQHTSLFIQDGGSGLLSWDGTQVYGTGVNTRFTNVNGGTANGRLVEREMSTRYTIASGESQALHVRNRGDSGVRWTVDANGSLAWMDGTNYTAKQSLSRNVANDHLLASSMVVTGRTGYTPNNLFPTGAVTLDSKLYTLHRIALTGSGSVTSMTVTNPVDAAKLVVQVVSTTGLHPFTWASNMVFIGAAPTILGANLYLTVEFIYNSSDSKWYETARSSGSGTTYTIPSQAEAEAGTSTVARVWTAERVKQAINALAGGGGGGTFNGYYFPETFGAVGDGVADDTTAIQNAFDAAYAAGGGTVILSARYGWTGDLEHRGAINVRGVSVRKVLSVDDNMDRGLVALGSTSRYLYGQWAGIGASTDDNPGGLYDLVIDGDNVGGATEGLFIMQCVDGFVQNCRIVKSAGNGILFDGTQNSVVDSCLVGENNGANYTFSRIADTGQGAGSVKINNCYGGTSDKQIYADCDPANYWAHDIFFNDCLFENYTAGNDLIHLRAGDFQFNNCVITNSNGGTPAPPNNCLVLVEQDIWPTIPTQAIFTGCYFNGSVGLDHLIRTVTASGGVGNYVRLYGKTYAFGADYVVCLDGGGAFTSQVTIDGDVFRTSGGGTTTPDWYVAVNGAWMHNVQRRTAMPVQWAMPTDPGGLLPPPISIRRMGDTTDRFQITRDGGVFWYEGAAVNGSLTNDLTNNVMVAGGTWQIANGFERRGIIITVPTPGFSVPLSGASTASPYQLIYFSATGATANVTISGGNPGGVLLVGIQGTGLNSISWSSDFHFIDDNPPQPVDGRVRYVELQQHVDGDWWEVHRSSGGDDPTKRVGELAFAENRTDVALSLTTTPNDVPDCVVVVPPTDQNVWINWSASITITVGGQGAVIGEIYEITGGTAVSRGAKKSYFLSSQPVSGNVDPNTGSVRVGPADHTRVFVLYGWIVREGSNLTASFQNLEVAPTWIQAEAK